MTIADLIKALRHLDKLYTPKKYFRATFLENTSHQEQYDKLKEQIEQAYPGMIVAYVDLMYRMGHVLTPGDEQELPMN